MIISPVSFTYTPEGGTEKTVVYEKEDVNTPSSLYRTTLAKSDTSELDDYFTVIQKFPKVTATQFGVRRSEINFHKDVLVTGPRGLNAAAVVFNVSGSVPAGLDNVIYADMYARFCAAVAHSMFDSVFVNRDL